MMSRMFISAGIFALGVATGAAALYLTYGGTLQSPAESRATSVEITPLREGSTQVEGESTQLYANKAHGFSLEYPKDLAVKEFDEGGGSQTIVFQQPSEQKGFQIFITPYSGAQITESRIKEDIPSGKVEDPKEVIIGSSIRALAFWSDAPTIGKSREVWFIHDGYLYEVTAYADLDTWLAEIIKSWKFI